MHKIVFSFIIILFTTICVNAKNISNDDILQSISKALANDKTTTKDQVQISVDSKNIEPDPEFGIKLIAPKINEKLHKKKLKAFEMLQKGHYEMALPIYKKLNKKYPNDNEIKFSLAYIYHKLKRLEIAKSFYYQLINSDYIFKQKAINNILEIITNQPEGDVLFILRKLSAENSNNTYILSRLALYYGQQNKLNEAILLMRKAHYLKPKQVSHKLNLAILYDKNQEYRNAIILYQQIVNDYSKNKITHKEVPIFSIKNRLEFIRKL